VNPFGWGNYQVNGSFGNQSAEYLDGQPLNIGYINCCPDSTPGFKYRSLGFKQQSGAGMGQVLGRWTNLSTKSGRIHSTARHYEYVRNRSSTPTISFLTLLGIQAARGCKPVRSKCGGL